MMRFDRNKKDYQARIARGKKHATAGKFVAPEHATDLLNAILKRGDRVCIEGDNQKQADFLARALLQVNKRHIRDLHMVQSTVALDEHVELFRQGIASRLDFAYSGPQSKNLYQLATEGKVRIGAIHTYLELYGRYFVDLYPHVSLLVAEACDAEGNIYTGFNTEDTALICEATHFKHGVVVIQVKEKRARLPRVDIPAGWIDFIIVTGEDYHLQPLFTRDPARITTQQIMMAMMVLKGIYKEYGVQALNHGLGYATAAIELLLPTYGRKLGLKGKYCTHWVLNPHPTLIPAVEAGFVKHIYAFGGEPGMEEYTRKRSDIFSVGADGNMRSNRCFAHIAGLYAIDLFIGATLQIDRYGNSSTAIKGMIAGFGGAPNLGGSPPGRRNYSRAVTEAGHWQEGLFKGRKLVVQITPTVSEKKQIPVFVNELDAISLYKDGVFSKPPVMISGDQVTHIVTETGIAYLDRCKDVETRIKAVAAVAGDTPVGRSIRKADISRLRKAGIVRTPEDLDIKPDRVDRKLLSAQNLQDLVRISGGLYHPPAGFKG
jgi:malonate decarboxylase alpha subunit